jgi:hypothetical protein
MQSAIHLLIHIRHHILHYYTNAREGREKETERREKETIENQRPRRE